MREESFKIKKPPLGLKPKWLHDEDRQRDVEKAIKRYLKAGCKLPQAWIDEYNSNCQ